MLGGYGRECLPACRGNVFLQGRISARRPRGDGHILLGELYQDEIRQAHPGCLSLLQIDEDDRWGLRFYDCGMYYFLVRPGDLKARRWHRVEGDLFFY